MKYLKDYEEKGFQGVDASLDISLYEYGLIWEERDTEYHFICGINIDNDGNYISFDWEDISKDVNFKKEFNWINWKNIFSYTGMNEEEFFQMSVPMIISDLISYYGFMNVFSESYCGGFEIIKEEEEGKN